jgi:syntaxin 16
MATRDLTTAYMRLRSALNRRRPGGPGADEGMGAGLTGASSASGVDTSALAGSPVYVDLVNDIQGDMNALQGRIDTLARLHESRLRITFDAVAENEKEREIEIVTAEITKGFNRCGMRVKRVDADQDVAAADAMTQAELRLRANIKRGLATRLHEMSTRFRTMQKDYIAQISKLRASGSFNALLGSAGGGGFPGEEERDTGFTDDQMHQLATAEEDVDERMREIQRIAKSVEELAVLFKDLATLVVEQGTILDRIDHNMEQAVEHTKKGVKELKKAEEYQKSARPIKCMALLMVLIIICVIIIIAKAGSSNN